jgi:hypothetical protein
LACGTPDTLQLLPLSTEAPAIWALNAPRRHGPQTLARAEQDKVSSSVDQAAGKTKDAASAAVDRAVDTATKLRGALNQATLDLDITQLGERTPCARGACLGLNGAT